MTFKPLRYAMVFFAALVVIEVLLFGVSYVMQQDMRNPVMGLIPFMGAAIFEGTKHAQATRDPIPNRWTQAAQMTLIGLGISILVAIPMLVGSPLVRQILAEYINYIIGAFAVGALLAWVITWFFHGFGAKTQWKAQDNQ